MFTSILLKFFIFSVVVIGCSITHSFLNIGNSVQALPDLVQLEFAILQSRDNTTRISDLLLTKEINNTERSFLKLSSTIKYTFHLAFIRLVILFSHWTDIIFIFAIAISDGIFSWLSRKKCYAPDHSYIYHRLKTLTTNFFLLATLTYLSIPVNIHYPGVVILLIASIALLIRLNITYFRVG